MSKFVIVNSIPTHLGKGETVIVQPNFAEQITAVTLRGGAKRSHTAINQLRDTLVAIQEKYGCDLKILKIPLSKYEGIAFETKEDLGLIITHLLIKERPDTFEKILEYNIKNRPYGTKLVYYVGRLQDTGSFFKNGLDMIEEKDVEEFLGRKAKKIVGKPAVTKEQSEESAG